MGYEIVGVQVIIAFGPIKATRVSLPSHDRVNRHEEARKRGSCEFVPLVIASPRARQVDLREADCDRKMGSLMSTAAEKAGAVLGNTITAPFRSIFDESCE
jgi:hypothetical protein